MNWMPIESAPKNEPILVYLNKQQFVAWFQDDKTDPWHCEGGEESELNGYWCVTDNKLGPFALRGGKPSHWTPLPPPPEEA
jgi:hypothetical protein